MMNLFNRSGFPLYRTNKDSWYYNEDGVAVFEETQLAITCNIQPYQDGDNPFRTPEGFQSIYAIEVYSKEELITSDEVESTIADEIEYKGRRWCCVDLADYTGHATSLIPQHYLGLFYRKDKI